MTTVVAPARPARGRLRKAAPPELQSAVRSLSRRVGAASAAQRMLPDFLIIGAQRCGTTSLTRALFAHPAVVSPLFHKGVNYFDVGYSHGSRWYQGHFPLRAVAGLRTRSTGSDPVTGDASGYYLFHPLAAERIAGDLPDVRLIALIRDPVERAYSAHRHEHARGFETLDFERALELEPTRLAGEADRMRADPHYQSFSHRHHAYLARGRYAEQLRPYYELCGPDRVLVLEAERFFSTPEREFDRVLAFLGLPRWQPATFERHNARSRDPLSKALRTSLRQHYESADVELAALLGAAPGWRC